MIIMYKTYDNQRSRASNEGTPGLRFVNKAELLQEGIIFHIHLFARATLLMKKLKIEETKATSIQLLNGCNKSGLSFFDYQFFH